MKTVCQYTRYARSPLSLLATAGAGATYEPKPSGMPALAAFPGLDVYPPAAPTITTPSGDVLVTSNSVPVAGTAEPYSTVTVTDGATNAGSASTDAAGNWSMTLSLADGVHPLQAIAADDAELEAALDAAPFAHAELARDASGSVSYATVDLARPVALETLESSYGPGHRAPAGRRFPASTSKNTVACSRPRGAAERVEPKGGLP